MYFCHGHHFAGRYEENALNTLLKFSEKRNWRKKFVSTKWLIVNKKVA
jgi:hypothetical protein